MRKLKIAFCLHGIASGKNFKKGGLPVDYKIGYQHYKKHLFDVNEEMEFDTFIHSWSKDEEHNINELYKPKESLYEKQITFYKKPNIIERIFNKKSRKLYKEEPLRKNNCYSRWYSAKKAIELKNIYEKENNFKYDFVFLTRFDLAFFNDIILNNFDQKFFYAPYWNILINKETSKELTLDEYYSNKESIKFEDYNRINVGFPNDKRGLLDFYFIANSDNMDKFSQLFDNLDKYVKITQLSNHSLSCEHLLTFMKKDNIKFKYRRLEDFDLVRRHFLNCAQ